MDLFAEQRRQSRDRFRPLAARMRPTTLDDFAGQKHFLGEGKLLRRLLDADRLASAIFYGPPGTGKTTLAEIIANVTQAAFVSANAASIGVKDIREILARARARLEDDGRRTVLFLDEIHRFNKAQQDVLLGDVEDGIVILVGATTENPFFAVNSALVSRSQIFQFEALGEDDVKTLIRRALADTENGLGSMHAEITDEALEFLAKISDGDARRALTALEVAVLSQTAGGDKSTDENSAEEKATPHHGENASKERSPNHEITKSRNEKAPDDPGAAPIVVDLEVAQDSIQRKAINYDATGDQHYDAASALIKSMRGSDPDAAIYWLAMMLEAGEDPRFIARRIAICAAEDVGNADPMALVLANAAVQTTLFVGLPECQLPLAQAAIYIACAPKSNASTMAIANASKDVKEGRTVPVPKHLRDGHYPGAKKLGNAEGYEYAHNAREGIAAQDYLGVDRTYYEPTDRGHEKVISEYLAKVRNIQGKQ